MNTSYLPLLYSTTGLHLHSAIVSEVLTPLESIELLPLMSTEAKILPMN